MEKLSVVFRNTDKDPITADGMTILSETNIPHITVVIPSRNTQNENITIKIIIAEFEKVPNPELIAKFQGYYWSERPKKINVDGLINFKEQTVTITSDDHDFRNKTNHLMTLEGIWEN